MVGNLLYNDGALLGIARMKVEALESSLPDKTAQTIRRVRGTSERACPGHRSAILQVIELGGEYRTIMELTRILDQGKPVSNVEQLKDQLMFMKDAFLYKKNFKAVRGMAFSGVVAMIGYMLVLRGELMQMDGEG